ncbi:MAG: class I SAM-dependent methyltransferase [Polyangiaceae bacterium]
MPAAPAPPEAPLPHPLDSLFPLLRPSRILLDDGDVLVIDKPFGLPTHETAPGDEHHAVARLKALLRARGQGDYLGIHQRLDKDTSGVLLFSRNPDRNRALAAEIEGRKAKKEYLAAVVLPKTAPKTGTLRAFIEKEKGGAVSVHTRKPKSRGAQEAITHYRVIERRADRALLAVIPETGRMHQIRAQLAHAGWPVAGDPLYGGPPAPRLLLHAARLSLAHPSGKGRIDVSSTIPDTFARWLTGDSALPSSPADIESRLRLAAEKRASLFHARTEQGQPETTAFRLANGAGDELPGVEVDVYDRHLVVSLTSPEAESHRDAVLDAAAALGPTGVYLKSRPKHASVLTPEEREARTPSTPVRGDPAPAEFLVREGGLDFLVRLGDGLQTGLFLDQRDNRRRVRELSAGLSVLNLFAYTGAFTAAAIAGGASRTVTVDVSTGAIERARKNLALLGATEPAHTCIDVDALLYLKSALKRGEQFDLVILDPPSFATTKTSTFSAKDDLGKVLSLALQVTAPGGRLLVSTNHRGIARARLRRTIHDAARDARRELWQVKDLPGTVDFPPEPGAEPAMKSVLVTAGKR